MNPDEQFEILKNALFNDYEGSIGDLIKQQEQQEAQVAQTPQEQEQGLRGQPPGSSMAFPNSSGDFNTMGMSEPLDISKVNNQGDVVRSYKSVPPGVGNLPMGDDVGTVIESPGTYKKGGFERDTEMFNLHQSLIKKKQGGGFDKDAFINQYLQSEQTGVVNTEATNKGMLANTVSTTQGSKYYNQDGTPMSHAQVVAKDEENRIEGMSDPIHVADAVGMTGIPIISELGDLTSAGMSTYRGNYGDAALSLAGAAVPFAGGAALKGGKSLYRVVNAKNIDQARKFGTTIPDVGTVGRRTGDELTRIQRNTPFDHISATTDQKWLTKGKNNLFDRYGGKNPYAIKMAYGSGKTASTFGKNIDDLAKIEPGSITKQHLSGPGRENITTIFGPKGTQVREAQEILSKADYLKLHNANPDFTWQKGGFQEKARKARTMRPPIGEHFEDQPEGTHSTHLMADNNNLEAWPSITNKKPPYSGYVKQSRDEAEAAGELFKFDTKKEMTNFARKGNWKLKLISDLHKDMKQKGGFNAEPKPATSQTHEDIMNVRETHDTGHTSLNTLMTDYMKTSGRNQEYIDKVMNYIGEQETFNDYTRKQDSYKTVNGKRIRYDGPGRGAFQYESGKGAGGNTAVNVTKQLLEDKLDIDFTKTNHSSVNRLYDVYKGTSADFSNLDQETQQSIFMAEKIYGGKNQRDAFDKLVKNRTSPPTSDEIFKFWAKYHKKRFKKGTKSWDKLNEEEKTIQKLKWDKKTKSMKQDGGFDYSPVPSVQDQTYVPQNIHITEILNDEETDEEILNELESTDINEAIVNDKIKFDKLPELYNPQDGTTYVQPPVIIGRQELLISKGTPDETEELVDIDDTEENKKFNENIQTNREIEADNKSKEVAQETVKKYFGKYTSLNKDDVINIQKEIVAAGKGSMLGKYGPNKDGVDGKFGPMTKAAYEQVLLDKLKSTKPLYFTPSSRDTYCTEGGCAEYVRAEYEREGYNSWSIGVGGSAWKMHQNILDHGGTTKFNIYDHSDFANITSGEQSQNLSIAHRKINKPDPGIFQVGDVVGLVYDESTAWNQAIEEHLGNSYNTHVGFVSSVNENGVPIISHNIHGKVYNDPYNMIHKGGIAWVASPKTDINEYVYEYDENQSEHNNTEYIDFLTQKREKYKEDTNELVEYSKQEKEVLNSNINFVKNNSAQIANDLEIPIDHKWLEEATLGISMVESHLGTDKNTEVEILASQAKRVAINELKRADRNINSLRGKKTDVSYYGTERGDISRGVAKIKLNGVAKGSATYYGLNEDTINDDDHKSLAYTMDRLTRRYSIISQYAKDNPTLGLTEQDVRNMTIITHNQGAGTMFSFGQNSDYSINEQLNLLRSLYYGDASDLSSTDWGAAEEILGPEIVNRARELKNEEAPESYISKVNRYVNRRVDPYSKQEAKELRTPLMQETSNYQEEVASYIAEQEDQDSENIYIPHTRVHEETLQSFKKGGYAKRYNW